METGLGHEQWAKVAEVFAAQAEGDEQDMAIAEALTELANSTAGIRTPQGPQ